MSRTRGGVAFVGLAAGLALIWICSVGVPMLASSALSPQDDKFSRAERLVYFRLEPGEVLRVPLPADPEALRLVTHVVLPEGTRYAPERQWVYGVDSQIVDEAEAELYRREVYARTRQSKARPEGDGWLDESAFAPDSTVQITDGRELLIPIPDEARGRGRTLLLRYPGPIGSLLVRVYGRTQQLTPIFALHQDVLRRRAEQRVDKATFRPWAMLTPTDHEKVVTAQWERLSAEGELELDYRILAIYRTGFRLPLVEVEESGKERLAPGRAVAVNVQGPADPILWLWTAGVKGKSGPVHVSALDTEGRLRRWELSGPVAGQASAHALELGDGIHTLTILNQGSTELHYTVEAPVHAGLTPPDRPQPGMGGTDATGLLPDQRRSDAFMTGPHCAPLEIEFGNDPGERLLRLDARAVALELGGLEPAHVRVEILNGVGEVRSLMALSVKGEAEPFEMADLGSPTLPCTDASQTRIRGAAMEVTENPALLSAAGSGRLFVPKDARRIRIHADRPVAVQLFRFHVNSEGARPLAPYDGVFEKVRWKNAPMAERHWHPMRPLNHRELSTQGGQITLTSQVRLEPLGDREERAPMGPAVAIAPLSPPRSEEMFEPVDPFEVEGRHVYTPLTPGKPLQLRFDAELARRPELRILTPSAEALGQPLEVYVNGKRVRRTVVRTSQFRTLLAPLPEGEHTVELRTEAPGMTATINRAAAGGGTPAFVERTAYQLSRRGLRVPVYKPGQDPVTLNVVVYSSSPAPSPTSRLRVTIDDGQPPRRSGVFLSKLTRSVRELPLPASTKPAVRPFGGAERWYPRTVAVTLGDDLGPGTHVIQVIPTSNERLWTRFFVYGAGSEAVAPRQWIRPGWEEETP